MHRLRGPPGTEKSGTAGVADAIGGGRGGRGGANPSFPFPRTPPLPFRRRHLYHCRQRHHHPRSPSQQVPSRHRPPPRPAPNHQHPRRGSAAALSLSRPRASVTTRHSGRHRHHLAAPTAAMATTTTGTTGGLWADPVSLLVAFRSHARRRVLFRRYVACAYMAAHSANQWSRHPLPG